MRSVNSVLLNQSYLFCFTPVCILFILVILNSLLYIFIEYLIRI